MSRYAVNSLLYRLKKDPAFRARFNADAAGALAGLDLTDDERAAFVARDMRRINALGGYLHLVMSVPGMAAHVTHVVNESALEPRPGPEGRAGSPGASPSVRGLGGLRGPHDLKSGPSRPPMNKKER